MEVDSSEDKDNLRSDNGTDGLSALASQLIPSMLTDSLAEMQVDGQNPIKNTNLASRRKTHPTRIEKKKQARKNRSSIVFATNAQHKKRKAAGKKKS
jgi:hypothetical protein